MAITSKLTVQALTFQPLSLELQNNSNCNCCEDNEIVISLKFVFLYCHTFCFSL